MTECITMVKRERKKEKEKTKLTEDKILTTEDRTSTAHGTK